MSRGFVFTDRGTWRARVCAALLSSAGILLAGAQPLTAQRNEPEYKSRLRELEPIHLTDAKMTRYEKAAHNLKDWAKSHQDAMNGDKNDPAKSWDDAAQELCERAPEVRREVTGVGLTCRDAVMLSAKLIITKAYVQLQDMGRQAPEGVVVDAADATYYRKHKAALDQAMSDVGIHMDDVGMKSPGGA